MDGLTSTKMIRAWERNPSHAGDSRVAAPNAQIPIFAVSASLVEKDRDIYMDAGFDGWILKPVDFKRLNTLLQGITDDLVRNDCLYEEGEWEKGGWFTSRCVGGKNAAGEGEGQRQQAQPQQDMTPTGI
jgi:hypothetical protein